MLYDSSLLLGVLIRGSMLYGSTLLLGVLEAACCMVALFCLEC